MLLQMMNVTCQDMLRGGERSMKTVQSAISVQTWYNYCRDVCTTYLKKATVKIGEIKIQYQSIST